MFGHAGRLQGTHAHRRDELRENLRGEKTKPYHAHFALLSASYTLRLRLTFRILHSQTFSSVHATNIYIQQVHVHFTLTFYVLFECCFHGEKSASDEKKAHSQFSV